MARDFIFLNCQDGKHAWEQVGGCNASCEMGDFCCCSVPIHECITCGAHDYGDNAEADAIRSECRATNTVNLPAPSLVPPLGWQH